ncbi:phosphoribosylformylglycinamidine synthase subunit PurQ [Campylobacter fetus]|uniref:Phosphoribosylformylglycinamidine synthase subunit PurQ n=1 Tax=Campylobacter fetus subsp. testudinum TaxID=1507806 RepID=A0AAX0H9Q2_CAMFE|nr:phosphoribosylformylglycinamidine synthase subunit PurQ [Campylobacter fetus]ALV64960.1 phosphoribosylformylglycinamidine synthase PurLQS, glutaminase subunit PurQ [Campylobacter fetus subsp. testudinum Sp3]AVK81206.1 phosphoribosylformylglycinamidine synthase subunit PurQ [Campylobacter fetus subsp. testudinum]EAK0825995.1 phosphoribosylformylglycinamidine synthase subunit PurQ [Campylobacter fetus]MPB71621.1 phosphoribosylformylglycinamidine synthase subunit PurQ [Campylobacter fetus]MPB7
MKVAIIHFPGTNCERDTQYAFDKLGCETQIIWHKETSVDTDLIILPGGFSYGDYLRTAAIAKFSPIMNAVVDHAKKGGLVLGICNGFQMLLETNLLDGAMRRNENMSFISKFHYLKIISNNNKFLSNLNNGDIVDIPLAHGEGNYYADDDTIKRLYDNDQVLLKYCDKDGNIVDINGSIDSIAGICNKNKNIFGLMPHPERAVESILGSQDGIKMLKGLIC